MEQIKAIVFEVSGVLLNDLFVVWKSDSEAYEACGMGKIKSMEDFKLPFKLSIHDYHRYLSVSDPQIPKIEAEYRRS